MIERRFSSSLGLVIVLLVGAFVPVLAISPNETVKSQLASSSVVSDTFTPHDAILIRSDEEFDSMASDEGWAGDGSPENPYVITGYLLSDPITQPVRIWNTDIHWIVTDNIIEGGGLCGCFIVNTTNGILRNNTFRYRHNGMAFQDVIDLIVENNSIYNNTGNGLEFLGDSTRVTVQNNRIENNRLSGIRFPSALDSVIDGNTIVSNEEHGIIIGSGANVVIENNVIDSNLGNGIFTGSSNCTIIDNIVRNSELYGIALTSGNQHTILRNTIEENAGYGTYLSGPVSNATISENLFIQNGDDCQIYDAGEDNTFVFNYYSDWTSPDENADDIVDVPYNADGVSANADLYPLVSPDSTIPDSISTTTETPPPVEMPLEPVAIAGGIIVVVSLCVVVVVKRKT